MTLARDFASAKAWGRTERDLRRLVFLHLIFIPSSALNRTDALARLQNLLAQELAPHDVRVLSVHPGPVRTEMLPERLLALAEAPSAVAEEVIRALADGTPLHVFPDPHSKQLATIMRPFLTKVVEGGDVYNRGK